MNLDAPDAPFYPLHPEAERRWRRAAQQRRADADLTAKELAAAARISASTVRTIEAIDQRPTYGPSIWTKLWIIGALDWPLTLAAASLAAPEGTVPAKTAAIFRNMARGCAEHDIDERILITNIRRAADGVPPAGRAYAHLLAQWENV